MLYSIVSVSAESAIQIHIRIFFGFPFHLGQHYVEFPVLNSRFSRVICFIYSDVCMSIAWAFEECLLYPGPTAAHAAVTLVLILILLLLLLKVAQSCPTLCVAMDDTVHGILQARIL